jgi:hypothetical protein
MHSRRRLAELQFPFGGEIKKRLPVRRQITHLWVNRPMKPLPELKLIGVGVPQNNLVPIGGATPHDHTNRSFSS